MTTATQPTFDVVLVVTLDRDVPGGITADELLLAVARLRGIKTVTELEYDGAGGYHPMVKVENESGEPIRLDDRLVERWENQLAKGGDYVSVRREDAKQVLARLRGEPEPLPAVRQGALPPTEILYLRSMGKALRVTAMFTDADAANVYMARHESAAVVAVVGGVIYLANRYDQGVKIDG